MPLAGQVEPWAHNSKPWWVLPLFCRDILWVLRMDSLSVTNQRAGNILVLLVVNTGSTITVYYIKRLCTQDLYVDNLGFLKSQVILAVFLKSQ